MYSKTVTTILLLVIVVVVVVMFVAIFVVLVAMIKSLEKIPRSSSVFFHRNPNKNDPCMEFLAPHVVKQFWKL